MTGDKAQRDRGKGIKYEKLKKGHDCKVLSTENAATFTQSKWRY
jgi:hypothetical protein